ncbi:MAG: hypothetical protein HYY16_08880 [Planctomycetes bacterium]|nr:hypothetical protein [Planctomycetota bacterium]
MVEGARKIIVMDHASSLRKVVEIVRLLDVPRPSMACRVDVTVPEVTAGEASVPEAFRDLDLGGATGCARFVVIAEASARGRGSTSLASVDLGGTPALVAEVDRPIFETRVQLTEDWTLLGVGTSGRQGSKWVFLARGVRTAK